jgi:disulfide bond formation protein DsbB
MAEQKSIKKTKLPFNPGLIVAIVFMILAAFNFLFIGSITLMAARDSWTVLAIGIDFPIIAVILLVTVLLIIMRKRLARLFVTLTVAVTIVLSLATAGVGAWERISADPEPVYSGKEFNSCVDSWKHTSIKTDTDSLYSSYSYDYVYQNGDRTLETYSEVREECSKVATRPFGANDVAMIIAQNIIIALIPSFAAIFVWLYFKQSDRVHEVLSN